MNLVLSTTRAMREIAQGKIVTAKRGQVWQETRNGAPVFVSCVPDRSPVRMERKTVQMALADIRQPSPEAQRASVLAYLQLFPV